MSQAFVIAGDTRRPKTGPGLHGLIGKTEVKRQVHARAKGLSRGLPAPAGEEVWGAPSPV